MEGRDVRITRIQELELPGMSWLLPDATPENLKTIDWIGPYVSDEGQGMASVHALLVETPDLVIGTYFAGPTAGRLVRDGGVYRLA